MSNDEHPSSTRWLYEPKINPGISGLKALLADSSKRRPLWVLLFVSILMALVLPLVNILFIYPAFTDVLVKSVEEETERIAAYLVPPAIKFSEVTAERLSESFYGDIYKLENDFGIVKVKIYAPDGEVLYSTDQDDIGAYATSEFFFKKVSRGEKHTVLVEKFIDTEEGYSFPYDIVETYYPIMNGQRFLGAFELYYDITKPKARLDTLRLYSTTIMIILSISLILAVLVLMRKEAVSRLAEKRTQALKNDIDRLTRHDLKSPFIGILSGLEYMESFTTLDEEQMSMTTQMREAAETGLDLINQSLSLYRMETGTYKYVPSEIDFLHTVRRVKENLADLAMSHGTGVVITLDGQPVPENATLPFRAEEPLCYTLLANLMKNALEASDDGDTVTINLEANEGIGFSVHNPAPVPQDVRDNFFDKYNTSGKTTGTGLGTYSARLMVQAMDGTITMETDDETGTTITVHLPFPPATEELQEQ